MIVAGRQTANQFDRIRQLPARPVVGEPNNLGVLETVGASWINNRRDWPSALIDVSIGGVHVIIAGTLKKFRMQSHAEQSVLAAGRGNLINRDCDRAGAVRRVDTRDAFAGALGYPEHVVRAPCYLPRSGQS